MRIQLIIFFLFVGQAFASSDREMLELFQKYDAVMLRHKVELVDDVFTKKFLKESGGKAEFIEKVKELPKDETKSMKLPAVSWKKGAKDEIFFANLKDNSGDKKKSKGDSGNRFIIIREDGKLKIDGTMSDAD